MSRKISRIALCFVLLAIFIGCKKDEPEVPVYRPTYTFPTVVITTENKAPVESKTVHVPCIVKYYEPGDPEAKVKGLAKIHTRGNATASYPKKPYKIRFDEKQSMGGFPENKDWVLLAMHCDHSLMRECYMHELAARIGADYPLEHKHVNVTINGKSYGTYLLIEQVERANDRVDLDDDGFIIERDGYYSGEPLYFMTDRGNPFTFKYPDANDQKIVQGDAEYNFIKDYMNKFEAALYGSNRRDPEKGYRKYIDARSWAKWYLVQELSGNMDTNHYLVMKNHGSKLQRGPVWDAEWSYGLAAAGSNGWARPSENIKPVVQGSYRGHWTYFSELFTDPYFIGLVKEEWDKLKPQIPQIHQNMAELAKSIKASAASNFATWPILNEYTSVGLVYFGDWQKEVDYVDKFLDEHIAWFDPWLDNKVKTVK